MMQSAQDWLAGNAPGCLDGAWYRCILIQLQVSSTVARDASGIRTLQTTTKDSILRDLFKS